MYNLHILFAFMLIVAILGGLERRRRKSISEAWNHEGYDLEERYLEAPVLRDDDPFVVHAPEPEAGYCAHCAMLVHADVGRCLTCGNFVDTV